MVPVVIHSTVMYAQSVWYVNDYDFNQIEIESNDFKGDCVF